MLEILKRTSLYIASRSAVAVLSVCLVLVLLQDTLIYPSAELWLFNDRPVRDPSTLPPGIESIMLPTHDSGRIEIWRMKVDPLPEQSKKVAIVAKGNGGSIESMLGYQRWLAKMGITSYSIEYRGYGFSTGWPSDSGIRADMEQLWNFVQSKEQSNSENTIILGVSLGTGPGSYLASLHDPLALVLVSPYTSIDDVIRERQYVSLLAPFVWTRFPSKVYIPKLQKTCVVAVHGGQDFTIRAHHTQDLQKLYRGTGTFTTIVDPLAGHNDIFELRQGELEQALARCLTPPNKRG